MNFINASEHKRRQFSTAILGAWQGDNHICQGKIYAELQAPPGYEKKPVILRYAILSLLVIEGILLPALAYAFCPVCTVAVGAGVGLSRYFGIDDTISGLWIGGLTISAIMWTLNWLEKKNIYFRFKKIITASAHYLIIVAPLYYINIIGHPLNTLWGIDKILLGVIFGSMSFYLGGKWYHFLKKQNNNRAHFPFQKVAMPMAPLVLLSIIFYFLTK